MKNLILFLFVLFISCDSNDSNQSFNIEGGIELYCFDQNGHDLLNPTNSEGLDVDNAKLFYLINGEEVEQYNAMRDAPKGFSLDYTLNAEGYEKLYYLNVGLQLPRKSEITTTIIQWNENDRDTLQANFIRTDGYVGYDKLWCNGQLVWDLPAKFGEKVVKMVKRADK